MTLQSNQVLNNRYRIVKLLATGGYGTVYRAWDLNLNIACAVKENNENSPDAQHQFNREASLLAKLNHPNLPRVTDHFIIPGQGQYLVMDYIEGEDLETMRCRLGGALPEAQVLPWIRQVCDALEYLHSQNPPVIHRDIKPANIRITPQAKAVLVDFGIAKQSASGGPTTIGAKAVTPGYSPPEQYTGAGTDERSDIYALGATLYTLLTGVELPESIQRAIGQSKTQPPHLLISGLRQQVSLAIMQAINPAPAQRFASVANFLAALETRRRSTQAKGNGAQLPRIAIFGGIFLLLAIGMIFLVGFLSSPSRVPAQQLPATTALTGIQATSSETPTQSVLPPLIDPRNLKTMRVNLGTYPDTIDPQKSSFVNEIAHLRMIYEGLTRLNGKLETVPGAAEKWEYNNDATGLTFTLRKGLKYSDGSLLNAKRFEYSILRNIDPATAGEYAGITDEIKGAPEWRSSDVTRATPEELQRLKEAVGVKALDSNGADCTGYDQADCTILRLTLSKPAPYFHTVMSLWVTYPAKEELITKGGETWWNDAQYHIGNGPMILESLEPNTKGVFKPNPYYWRGAAKIGIEFRYITDTAVAFQAYRNNEFDVIPLGAENLPIVKADPVLSKEAQIYPGSCTYSMDFHQLKEPFTDKAVREAFAYSFDRDAWVKDVLKDLGAPARSWIPPGFPGYDAGEDRFPYDPAKTKSLLEAAGYTIEGGQLIKVGTAVPITLTFSDTPRNRTRFEWISGKWMADLGLEVRLNPVEPTTYTALTKDVSTAPQLFILGWCADYPDPQNWLSVYFRSTSPFAQRFAYASKEFDALADQADVDLDAAKRADLYSQAQKLIIGDVAGVMLWNNVNSYLVKPTVKGIIQTPQDSGWPGEIDPLTVIVDTGP